MNLGPRFGDDFRKQLQELFEWRRDVRRFRSTPLEAGTLQRLVNLACLAPSVGLSQPWRIVTVDDTERRAAIRRNFERCNATALAAQTSDRAANYARLKLAGLDDAPVQLAIFVDHGTHQGHGLGRLTMPEMIEYSAVAAIHTLWLAARAEGIGLGWVSILNPLDAVEALDVPREWKLVGYLCLGYPKVQDQNPELEREGWERRRSKELFLIQR